VNRGGSPVPRTESILSESKKSPQNVGLPPPAQPCDECGTRQLPILEITAKDRPAKGKAPSSRRKLGQTKPDRKSTLDRRAAPLPAVCPKCGASRIRLVTLGQPHGANAPPTARALLVTDDPGNVEAVAEVLASLGHGFDTASSQEEARRHVHGHRYDYLLLDVAIPALPRGGSPRIQNGLNLLESVVGSVPVIVLLDRRAERSARDTVGLAVATMRKGAADVVRIPLSHHGRTLDKAIKKALAKKPRPAASTTPTSEAAKPAAPLPFAGGEMVFFPDRVELCGVKVLGDTGAGQTRRLIQELSRKGSHDKFVCRSGAQLAKAIGADGGQNSVAGCVRNFRQSVTRALAPKGIACGRQDVIQSGGQGYRLREWIIAREENLAAPTRA
jgi:CheY-like chemotaxis protein